MKILLLADIASEHTQKWAIGLAENGVKIGIFSFNKSDSNWYEDHLNIQILFESLNKISGSAIREKIGYLNYLSPLKQKIKEFNPDIVHAHYATSYGLLGALSGFRPFIISVWGSDVYDFPEKSILHKQLMKWILKQATFICSTSHCMKNQTEKFFNKEIHVVPFGINVKKFSNFSPPKLNEQNVNVGIIKSLEIKYGIDYLIKAFKIILEKYPEKRLKLILVGDGSQRRQYEEICRNLKIDDHVFFAGKVPNQEIVQFLQKIDIFVSLSILDSESFGVSLVEAMAAARPIVATNVDGFSEVLGSDDCGLLVNRKDEFAAAEAIEKYILNPDLAIVKGLNSQKRAMSNYNWNDNLETMIKIYKVLLK